MLATVDITNAYNGGERQAVLEGVARFAPHLLPWVSLSLGVPSPLFCGQHEIQSRCGVHQGNPLGPLLFCLATLQSSQRLNPLSGHSRACGTGRWWAGGQSCGTSGI